jgi:hypothetical protein
MKKIRILLLLLPLVLQSCVTVLMSGSGALIDKQNNISENDQLLQLDDYDVVVKKLGTPDIIENHVYRGQPCQIIIYQLQDLEITDEMYPLDDSQGGSELTKRYEPGEKERYVEFHLQNNEVYHTHTYGANKTIHPTNAAENGLLIGLLADGVLFGLGMKSIGW